MSRAPRSLPDGDVLTEKILEQLRTRSPMSPGDLNAAVKADKMLIRARVKRLEAAGQVTTSGATTQRLVHLASSKAAPKPNGAPQKSTNGSGKDLPAASSALDVVEAIDNTVLGIIRAAGYGGRTLRELQISRPDESESALTRSLTRLSVKKRIQADDNGRWTTA